MVIVEEILEHESVGEQAELIKKSGNEHFGKGEWKEAAGKYREALNLCPTEDASLQSLRAVLLSNLAAALLKQELWTEAAEAASKAIEENASNEKALERRAFAFFHISDKFEAAQQDYEELIKQFPDRAGYRVKKSELEAKIAKRNEEMKEDVMNKLKGLGNMILKPFGLSTNSFELTPNDSGGYSIQMKQNKAPPPPSNSELPNQETPNQSDPEKSDKMSKTHPPELKKYMDKEMEIKLNGNRRISGTLRGYDPFMNMVIEDAIEYPKTGDPVSIGMVVVRGNSVVIMEPKERIQ
ncbi:hypothetical protein WR25_13179 [Diploscapter pachys]|uniref:Sm domain-containing protein n=1 Tax=Diploscapter pachys TaxID=2018661 RepID=A0A2A2LL95_9BILA|nr:hypothetical protein WR25_13179 [Diploscapter pachys]